MLFMLVVGERKINIRGNLGRFVSPSFDSRNAVNEHYPGRPLVVCAGAALIRANEGLRANNVSIFFTRCLNWFVLTWVTNTSRVSCCPAVLSPSAAV